MIDTKTDERPSGRHASLELPDDTGASGAIYAARHEVVDWSDLSRSAPVRTVFGRIGVRTAQRTWLAKLPSTWRVVPSVPAGEDGANVGDVVIGPGGVHVVSANDAPDAVTRVAGLLSAVAGRPIEVGAVVVTSGAERKQLSRRLGELPTTLSDADIEALHTLARRSTTWQSNEP